MNSRELSVVGGIHCAGLGTAATQYIFISGGTTAAVFIRYHGCHTTRPACAHISTRRGFTLPVHQHLYHTALRFRLRKLLLFHTVRQQGTQHRNRSLRLTHVYCKTNKTSRGGRNNRASASRSVAGLNLDLTFSKPGRVKPMTFKIDTCRFLAWCSGLLG